MSSKHNGKKTKKYPNFNIKYFNRIFATIKPTHFDFAIGFIKEEECFDYSDFTNTAIRKLEELYELKHGKGSVARLKKIGQSVIKTEKKRRLSPPKAKSIKNKEDELTWTKEDLEDE